MSTVPCRTLAVLAAATTTSTLVVLAAPTAVAQTPGEPGLLAVMRTDGPTGPSGVYTLNADGSQQKLVWAGENARRPAFSPDGSRIALTDSDADGNRRVHTVSVTGADPRTVSPSTHRAFDVTWSPDGRELAYTTNGDDLYVVAADGTGEARLLADTDCLNDAAWSVDGHIYLTLCDQTAEHPDDVHRVAATGGPVTVVADTPEAEIDLDVSPDGGLLVVASGETSFSPGEPGRLWLMGTDGSGRGQVDVDRYSTRSPVFSPDGAQVAFVATDPTEAPDERTRTHVLDIDSGLVRVVPTDLVPGQQEYNVAWQPLPSVQPGDLATTVSGGETVSTGSGATPEVPVQTTITVPAGVSGTVTVDAQPATSTPPTGFGLFGQQVVIEGPPATASAPYTVTFTLDAGLLAGIAPADVQVWRDGSAVSDCTSPTAASPDPCVVGRTATGDGDAAVTVRTAHFSTWTFGHPAYDLTGPLWPVDAQPTVNTMQAGSAAPVRFRLGGNRGTDVLAPGYPQVLAGTCSGLRDPIELTVPVRNSSLSYEGLTRTYIYAWKTTRAATGCRELVLRFRDGSELRATFLLR